MRFDLGCRPLGMGSRGLNGKQQQPQNPLQRGVNNIRVMNTTLTALRANVATGQELRKKNNFKLKHYQQASGLFVEVKDPSG